MQILNGVERRRDPFITGEKAEGYYILPAPYNLRGIGSGIFIAGSITNAFNDYTDYTAFVLTGDIKGYGIVATEFHLIDKSLLLDVFSSEVSEARTNIYASRGMNSDDDDYTIIGVKNVKTYLLRLTKTQPSREYETGLTFIRSNGHLDKQYDQNGDVLQDLDSDFDDSSSLILGFRIDKSDDYQDPRDGHVTKLSISKGLSTVEGAADFAIGETDFSYYLPMRTIDTWVFNAFYSRSIVLKEGEVNTQKIERILGVNCDKVSPTNNERCAQLIQNTKDENKYGNATALGGRNRLRAYPQSRFKGSKTIFFGTEYRLNFFDIPKFFDVYLARGTKSNFQMAFFGAIGSAVDHDNELFDKFANSFGIGFRLVLSSGFVFRIDAAMDTQSNNYGVTSIIGYPWDSF